MLDLSVVILTYNEERHIVRALESIRGIAKEIFVIDSFSNDRTVELAEAGGAMVLKNKFVNQAQQFEWGVQNAPITGSWIMRLDADEVIEPDLAAEIEAKLPTLGTDVVGINLKRKHIFMDRWIRHGGRYPLILLRIWRRGHGRVENRWMDEHIITWGGRTVTFDGGFSDHNINDLTFFTDKHNKYATREAIDVLNRKYRLFPMDEEIPGGSASFQASIKRWIKEGVYNKLPLWVGPAGFFIYRYILKLGFFDGQPGLIYHFLQGGWYRFLVGSKVVEYERELVGCANREERLEKLEKLTGYRLRS
ncbi:glycosyltransferase family 2 protein [Xanthobacter sp. YC-JY1]|uniref:glycosyltransferase family 2 protein n=1 Tax=Xanthobacter sp. YC-JY1 TaxID=2419844 RepID=UPI001F298559|nr:glycosyltransferase family 2 protein [Xanthobacter sp. YC-JY1]UJX45574.1 glycosyltransferase family 2 protein [Xanthobacter sp. YC-JY1]